MSDIGGLRWEMAGLYRDLVKGAGGKLTCFSPITHLWIGEFV